MFYSIKSASINGLNVSLINVETDISSGLPIMQMVGKLSGEVRESGERVRTVLKNSGFKLPSKRIIINLAPANIRKSGTSYDLPIAISVLGALDLFGDIDLSDTVILGELTLNGKVLSVNGILPIVIAAKENNIKKIILPKQNLKEAKLIDGIKIIGVDSLDETIDYILDEGLYQDENDLTIDCNIYKDNIDFSDIKGQHELKRAAIVAVSGMHNILLFGPPGSGKSMMAKRLPTIQPKLSKEESISISKVYSIKGMLSDNLPLITSRPFRSPHHSITPTALIGGGSSPMPGEISLANGGVLFLDEFPEFPRHIIELLRQPLEDHTISINRSNGSFTYPARFQLVAAMNPCPCGYYPNLNKCTCTENDIKKYLSKISGPILDRIDICINVSPTKYDELSSTHNNNELDSLTMRNIVERTQQIQKERYKNTNINFNAYLTPKEILKYCNLGNEENNLMKLAYDNLGLTARSYHKVLRVARTIADIDESKDININHLKEALQYRSLPELNF